MTDPETYLEQIAAQLGVTYRQLVGESRAHADARAIAAWAVRETYGLKLKDIGDLLGYADHTTPRYHIQKVAERAKGKDGPMLRALLGRRVRLIRVWQAVPLEETYGPSC